MTKLNDEVRAMLLVLARVQDTVNQLPKEDIVELDLPDFALVCRALKSQSYGSLGERWLCKKLGLTRITGNKDYDAVWPNGLKSEIKFTMAGPGRKFNVVQVRPYADLDGYLIFGINSDNTGQIWCLNKQDMANELKVLRAGSAHGKFDQMTTQEYRFSFAEGDDTYNRWSKYRLLTVPGM